MGINTFFNKQVDDFASSWLLGPLLKPERARTISGLSVCSAAYVVTTDYPVPLKVYFGALASIGVSLELLSHRRIEIKNEELRKAADKKRDIAGIPSQEYTAA